MMKRILFALALLFLAAPLQAQVSSPQKVVIKNEGTAQGIVGQVDCVGTGIACAVSGDVGTITVGAGSVSISLAIIDFRNCTLNPIPAPIGSTRYCSETITDAAVTGPTTRIMVGSAIINGAFNADEDEMSPITCTAVPATGTFRLNCSSYDGPSNVAYNVAYILQ